MSEIRVLEIVLWVFATSFAIKCIVFGWLAFSLRGQRDITVLGRGIKLHYISLSAQAAALTIFYTYYATAAAGNGHWLDENQRITIYIVGAILASWATFQGVQLMVAYRQATRRQYTDDEQVARKRQQDDRDALQDIREREWNAGKG